MIVYRDPTGRLRDADQERELIEMSLADACGFEYYAPAKLSYGDSDSLDWWSVFWSAVERHESDAIATGQRSLEDFAAATGGESA